MLNPTGAAQLPALRRRSAPSAIDYPAPNYPGPAGIGGYYPAQVPRCD